MLQIVTKMYFREGVPLHSREHRNVLYTNCGFLWCDPIELPVGELLPSTGMSAVSTVMVSITEHLEAEELDGSRSMRVSTGGLELIDDLGIILSFGLNAVFSRNHDLVRRLVPDSVRQDRQTQASRLFGRTFEADRYVREPELDEFRGFMTQLLSLKRQHFEAAMRAMKRIVAATQRAPDDPTQAYVDIVAALESLSAGFAAPPIDWNRMPARERALIDNALTGDLPDGAPDRIRKAVTEAYRLGTTARYLAFVVDHVSPSFFRAEAVGVKNPIRGADLERLVKQAYEIRSLNVHALRELRYEAWMHGSEFETVAPANERLMLTHVGLLRLARHVLKNYVDRAPVGLDADFDWRAYLPGTVMMRAAPQYWIWQAPGFDHKSVTRFFSGFVEHLVAILAGREEGLTDMTPVLERIEKLVPGLSDGSAKAMMVAIYALWHGIARDHHRPEASQFLAKYQPLLDPPAIPAFVTGLLLGTLPSWRAEQWQALATDRRQERAQRYHLQLPASLDAALQVAAAQELAQSDDLPRARKHAGFAVEELPGDEQLLIWEPLLGTDDAVAIDVWKVALQPQAPPEEEAGHDEESAEDHGSDTGEQADVEAGEG
jgi:hypothetical protein